MATRVAHALREGEIILRDTSVTMFILVQPITCFSSLAIPKQKQKTCLHYRTEFNIFIVLPEKEELLGSLRDRTEPPFT